MGSLYGKKYWHSHLFTHLCFEEPDGKDQRKTLHGIQLVTDPGFRKGGLAKILLH